MTRALSITLACAGESLAIVIPTIALLAVNLLGSIALYVFDELPPMGSYCPRRLAGGLTVVRVWRELQWAV